MSACLFGKRLPPPEARCNPHAESQVLIGLIMVPVLLAIPPEGRIPRSRSGVFFFPLRVECVVWVSSLSLSSGVRRIALDSFNRL